MNVTTSEAVKVTGLSAVTLRGHAKKRGMPGRITSQQGRKVLWDLALVVPWLLDLYRNQYGSDPDTKNFAYERQRLIKAQADHEELDYLVKCGQLIDFDMVLDILSNWVALFKSSVQNLGGRLANELLNET